MGSSSQSEANCLGPRFYDYLNGLREEFEHQLNATSAKGGRARRFNTYLEGLKCEFELMAEDMGFLQKERDEFEAKVEAQAKELRNVCRNLVCERCSAGIATARWAHASSPWENMKAASSPAANVLLPSSLKKSGNQAPWQGAVPFYTTPTYSDTIDAHYQNVTPPSGGIDLEMTLMKRPHSAVIPVRPSHTTSRSSCIIVAHPLAPAPASSLPQASAKDGSVAFNDKVEKKLDVEIAHTLFHRVRVKRVQFSPDGKYLAAGCHDGKAYIYDVKSGTLTCVLRNLFSKEDPINTICFSRDIKYLATGSWDGNLYIWEIKTRYVRNGFKGHTRYIISLDFSPNGQQLVSTSNDNTVRLWNMRDGAARFLTEENPTFLDNPCYTSAVFSPDGLYVAASHRDGMVRIWSARTGQLMRRLKAHLRYACDVAFVPDGKGLISGGSDSTLRYWNVSSLYTAPIRARLQAGDPLGEASRMEEQTKPERELLGHNDSIQCLAISPDGNWVVSGSRDQTVRIWDTRNAELQCNLKHDETVVFSVDFSPAGDYLASGGHDGMVRIWSCSSHNRRGANIIKR